MKIDLTLKIEEQNISAVSNVANYSETMLANIGLSKLKGKENSQEMIEFIGEDFSEEQMKNDDWFQERDKGGRIYRVTFPFKIDKFEPIPASRIVDFYSRKVRFLYRGENSSWRYLLGIDKIELAVKLPNYDKVFSEKRELFEKQLKKITKEFSIQS